MVADEAVAADPDRVRLRGEVERERMRAYRHPAVRSSRRVADRRLASSPRMALRSPRATTSAWREARYPDVRLAWLRGASERGCATPAGAAARSLAPEPPWSSMPASAWSLSRSSVAQPRAGAAAARGRVRQAPEPSPGVTSPSSVCASFAAVLDERRRSDLLRGGRVPSSLPITRGPEQARAAPGLDLDGGVRRAQAELLAGDPAGRGGA
jgi:hypothetical protein